MSTEHSSTGDDPLIGRVLGSKFRLRLRIGAGASGTVYQADQTTLGRTVAVKILNPGLADDPRLVSRFHDEAMAASRLNHPNTVSIIDYGQAHDGLLYIVMEFLRGATLTHIIFNEFPIPDPRIIDIAAQILSGLEEAHHAGIVHADLKSDNIVVERRRNNWDLAKVVDFGIARLVNTPPEQSAERTICGTPEYMAPEVIRGADPTFASDLYAVGVMLYEMLTGETPFVGGSSIQVLTRHLRQDPVLPSRRRPDLSISAALESIAMRALSKDPSKRYATAQELRSVLEEAMHLDDTLDSDDDGVDVLICAACQLPSRASFKFCPECGHPREPTVFDPFSNSVPELIGDTATSEEVTNRLTVPRETRDELSTPGILPLPLVDRQAAFDALLAFATDRGETSASIMEFVGPPGCGRSRTISAVCEHLAKTGGGPAIYRVGPDPTGLRSPFAPIRAIVARVLALPVACPYERLGQALDAVGLSKRDLPGIGELFGHHGELWQLEPNVRRRELLASALRALRAVTHNGDAALIFEDVERFDQPSRELLGQLVELEDDRRLRVIVSHGPAYTAPWSSYAVRLELGPLDDAGLSLIARHVVATGHEGMPDAATLARLTDGNPAHVEHLIRFVIEGGELDQAPDTVGDLIAERLKFLGQPSRVACQVAAVFGVEVERDTLRRAVGDRVGDGFPLALSVLRARGFLVEPSGDDATVRFAHALVRDVVYDATPADVRRELHAAALEALSQTTSDALILGHHYERAGRLVEAADFLVMAGDAAVHQLDDDGATDLYHRALEAARSLMLQSDDADSRQRFVTLSVKLSDALRVSGQIGLARGIVEEARGYSDGTPALDAQLLRALAHLYLGEDDTGHAIALIRRAIGILIPVGQRELLAELYLDLSSIHLRTFDGEGALRELSEGLDLVTLGEGPTAQDGPLVLWRILLRMARLHVELDRLPQAVKLAEAALRHARRVQARAGIARSQSTLAQVHEKLGNLAEASKFRDEAVSEMRRLGDRRGTAELLLAGVHLTSTVMRITPESLREASQLADEIGWPQGKKRARDLS